MGPAIEDHPLFSHYCIDCGKPVARARAKAGEIGSMSRYGSGSRCAADVDRLRYQRKKNKKQRSQLSPRDLHNLAGLQHYIEQRRKRLESKCQLSM